MQDGRLVSHTCVWVLCEPKSLWSTSISVIDKAKVQHLACAAEQLADLLFGQSWGSFG